MLKTISFLCVIALAAASFLITEPIEGTRFLSPNNTMPCRFAGNVSMVPYAVTPGQTIKINVEFVDPLGGGPMAVSLNGQAPALATAIIADNQTELLTPLSIVLPNDFEGSGYIEVVYDPIGVDKYVVSIPYNSDNRISFYQCIDLTTGMNTTTNTTESTDPTGMNVTQPTMPTSTIPVTGYTRPETDKTEKSADTQTKVLSTTAAIPHPPSSANALIFSALLQGFLCVVLFGIL